MTDARRVVVTAPPIHAERVPPYPRVRCDIDERAGPGAAQVRSLMRAQLRLALVTCGVVALVLGALPLVFALAPRLSAVRVHGIPLPWLILGLGVQPLWIAAAAQHVRHAERAERDFIDLVTRS